MTERQRRTNKTWWLAGLAVALVGAVGVWSWASGGSRVAEHGGDDGGRSEDSEVGRERARGTARGDSVASRPVSSAAQEDYEGGEKDDWDSLDPAGRIARTEARIEVLRAEIAQAGDAEEKAGLEEEALEALAVARADFFLESEMIDRYLALESSFGG